IITTLQAQGVAFRSRTEQMDTTTLQGAFLLRVFGALAPYERALTQERMRAGLEAARRRGKRGRTASGDQRRKTRGHPRRLACGSQHSLPLRDVRGVKRTTLSDALARAAAQTVPLIKGGA